MKFEVQGARIVSGDFRQGAKTVLVEERAAVRKYARLLETRIKAKASGRPGPNAPTGDYRRSWGTRLSGNASYTLGEVGTNAPQGRRLEFGFVGTDSLGRNYNQPPYPHVGPAVDEVEPLFIEALKKVVPE